MRTRHPFVHRARLILLGLTLFASLISGCDGATPAARADAGLLCASVDDARLFSACLDGHGRDGLDCVYAPTIEAPIQYLPANCACTLKAVDACRPGTRCQALPNGVGAICAPVACTKNEECRVGLPAPAVGKAWQCVDGRCVAVTGTCS